MTTIFARPDAEPAPIQPGKESAVTLQEAIDAAQPGTTIVLLPGRFTSRIKIKNRQGRDGMPIVIQGDGKQTVIDGEVYPHKKVGDDRGPWPSEEDFDTDDLRGKRRPFFRMKHSAWIEFRNIYIKNCWPFACHVVNSHHITMSGCEIKGSTVALYLEKRSKDDVSHHILLQNNYWTQDPTNKSENKIWNEWTWQQIKDRNHTDSKIFMQGAFVGSDDVAGDIVVRNNYLERAFNAIRLAVEPGAPSRPIREVVDFVKNLPSCEAKVFDREPDQNLNKNVEIYGNTFRQIRDNAIEPEHGAVNWWVHHNVFEDVHKIFSIHNVGGGYWYFFGNRGSTEAIPPAQTDGSKLGGKIYKFYVGPPLPEKPCFAFHNSWRPRGAVFSGDKCCRGEMRLFRHLNNVAEHCAPATPADLQCGEVKFVDDVELIPVTNAAPQSGANRLDSDVSNAPEFPDTYVAAGFERRGQAAGGPVFQDRAAFTLDPNCPAKGLAETIELRAGIDWPAQENWPAEEISPQSAPDCGAVQPDGPYEGPPFAHLENARYISAPRLVAVREVHDGLVLVFSEPLSQPADSIAPTDMQVVHRAATGAPLSAIAFDAKGRRLRLRFADPTAVPPPDAIAIALPRALTGASGQSLTAWAAVVPLELSDRPRVPVG